VHEPDPPISVQPDTYHVSSSIMGEGAATDLLQASFGLAGGLSGTGGMGGTDQAGQDWATSYDDAASTTSTAIGDLVNALQVIAGMLKQTGFNHRAADAASNPANPAPPDIVDSTDYSAIPDYHPGPPPSAHGGSGDPPWGWKVVEYAVGYLWPNGDPGKLRSAATAWTQAANDLANASGLVPHAVSQIQTQQSPEVHDAVTVCQAMAQHINDVATSCGDIATACTNYAQQIDQVHQEIADEITSFLEWSAGIELGAAILSEVGGEIWGQGVEGVRIAKTGANIARIIEKLIEFVKTAVQAVRNVVSKIGEVAQNLTKFLGARLSKALTKAAEKLKGKAKTAEESKEDQAAAGLKDAAPKVPVDRAKDVQDAIFDKDGNIPGTEDSKGVRMVSQEELDGILGNLRSKLGEPDHVIDTPKGRIETWDISSDPPSTVTYRTFSKSGGPTIDINKVDGVDTVKRFHVTGGGN
jgi:hypothetical protein